MNHNEAVNVQLIGLPGSGRHRLQRALAEYQQGRTGNSDNAEDFAVQFYAPEREKGHFLAENTTKSPKTAFWAVVDMRSAPQTLSEAALDYLQRLIEQSSAVIWQFADAADLETQTAWQSWLKKTAPGMPAMHCLAQTFKFPHQGLEALLKEVARQTSDAAFSSLPVIENWQRFEAQLPKVILDHLLMGLDASRQNLQMALWRVKGTVQTLEYVNPVAIEGTINRWDTFAGDLAESSSKMGALTLEGVGLDATWLTQILQASIAPGGPPLVDNFLKTY
jgi:hypothetical protein